MLVTGLNWTGSKESPAAEGMTGNLQQTTRGTSTVAQTVHLIPCTHMATNVYVCTCVRVYMCGLQGKDNDKCILFHSVGACVLGVGGIPLCSGIAVLY